MEERLAIPLNKFSVPSYIQGCLFGPIEYMLSLLTGLHFHKIESHRRSYAIAFSLWIHVHFPFTVLVYIVLQYCLFHGTI